MQRRSSTVRLAAAGAGLVASLLLLACAEEEVTRIDLLAFSTTVSFSVYAPPDHFQSTVVPAIEQRMALLELRWRSFGDGQLGTLNRALESGQCATPDPDTFKLIATALSYRTRSNGLFDPTLGLEVDAWGFRDVDQPKAPPPPAAKGQIRLEGTQVCSNGPVRLDLGGIAKGAIVSDLAALLDSYDIKNAIINVGGDLLVLGQRGDKAWRVAVQHPRRQGVIARIEAASGEAIFSSGDYHRRRQVNGQMTHHILDPRTGAPSIGAVATTVIHSDPLLADVAATALLVAGADDFEAVAANLGISRAVLIDSDLRIYTLKNTHIDLPQELQP